jgi:hypothetical protein
MSVQAAMLTYCEKTFENAEHIEVQEALDLIGTIFQVEHEAKKAKLVKTDAFLAARKEKSLTLFARLLVWALKHRRASNETLVLRGPSGTCSKVVITLAY